MAKKDPAKPPASRSPARKIESEFHYEDLPDGPIELAARELLGSGLRGLTGGGVGRNKGQDVIWLFARRINRAMKVLRRDGFKGFRVVIQRSGVIRALAWVHRI